MTTKSIGRAAIPRWLMVGVVLLGSLGLLLGGRPACSAPVEGSRSLQLLKEQYDKRQAAFAREMNRLAEECESQLFFSDAARIRERARRPDEATYDVDDLPESRLPPLPLSLPDGERQWRATLLKLEKEYAIDLYRLARQSLKQHPSFAFQLTREVAFRDPDHRQARQMLGYVLDGDNWTTPYARTMHVRGYIDDPEFGWLPKKDVDRYRRGERFFNGTWMSAEKEAALRSDFRFAWQAKTEHFEVRTNVSLEKGVEIARALETFHAFFLREFTALFNTPAQMQRLFDGGAVNNEDSSRRHTVYFLRSRDEFVALLKSRQSNISLINGLYIPGDRIAYFFDPAGPGEGPVEPQDSDTVYETIFHEVTHQILSESGGRVVDIGENSDFWVIEGIACYMESFNPRTRPISVGDPRHIRIFWARHNAIDDDLFVPMRQFTAMGKREFQFSGDNNQIHAYYSQAAGMVNFFLHAADEAYRDAFIEYLSQVYSPSERIRRKVTTLEQLTGVQFETLDDEYREYLRSLPAGPPAGTRIIPAGRPDGAGVR